MFVRVMCHFVGYLKFGSRNRRTRCCQSLQSVESSSEAQLAEEEEEEEEEEEDEEDLLLKQHEQQPLIIGVQKLVVIMDSEIAGLSRGF